MGIDKIIKRKDGIFENRSIYGSYRFYLTYGMGCGTIFFNSVESARLALQRDGVVNGSDLVDCSKCRGRHNYNSDDWKKYPDFLCKSKKEQYAKSFEGKVLSKDEYLPMISTFKDKVRFSKIMKDDLKKLDGNDVFWDWLEAYWSRKQEYDYIIRSWSFQENFRLQEIIKEKKIEPNDIAFWIEEYKKEKKKKFINDGLDCEICGSIIPEDQVWHTIEYQVLCESCFDKEYERIKIEELNEINKKRVGVRNE